MDWAAVDLAILNHTESMVSRYPKNRPEARSLTIALAAVAFLVAAAQRAWSLQRMQHLQTCDRPVHPRELAYHKYILAEQEYLDDARNAGADVDFAEVLEHLKRLSLESPAESPTFKSISLLIEAVVSASEDSMRPKFLRFAVRIDGPATAHQKEYYQFIEKHIDSRSPEL